MQFLLWLAVMAFLIAIYLICIYARAYVFSPLRHVPTVPPLDPIFGGMSYLMWVDGEILATMARLRLEYGRIRRSFLAFGESRLIVSDIREVKRILGTNARAYTVRSDSDWQNS